MATTKEFHDFILENLQKVGEVSTRKMMGEYCVYYQGKMIGDICDNCLFLKPTASVLRLLPDAERAYPYEGSKDADGDGGGCGRYGADEEVAGRNVWGTAGAEEKEGEE